MQVVLQAIPAGLLITVPVPKPALPIVRVTGGAALKVAVQFLAAVIVTEMLGVVPVQAPLQLANTEPALG